jgi:hypothetical protein
MAKKHVDNQKIHLLILQESIWQIEDKIDRTLEQIGRQEAALLKIRSLAQEIEQKLGIKPARRHKRRPSK